MKIFIRYFLVSFIITNFSYTLLNAMHCPHCSDLRDDCLQMRTYGGGSSGKWLDNNTPKRGWSCTGAEDLGKGITVECEMCEREKVRYIHHMSHGDKTPLKLRVGCICAGHMEGREDDEQAIKRANSAAKQRDKDLRNRTARRD